MVKLLMSATDNPNAANIDGITPIFRAAINGHLEIVQVLIPSTINPNAAIYNGWSPIHVAARNFPMHLIMLEILLTILLFKISMMKLQVYFQ